MQKGHAQRAARHPLQGIGDSEILSLLIKFSFDDYGIANERPAPQVPLEAASIAEPSDPEYSVSLLDCLTPEESDFYSSEEAVLSGGKPRDAEVLLSKFSIPGLEGAKRSTLSMSVGLASQISGVREKSSG